MTELEELLDQSNEIVESALDIARAELADLDERRRYLIEMIDRAEAIQRSHTQAARKDETNLARGPWSGPNSSADEADVVG